MRTLKGLLTAATIAGITASAQAATFTTIALSDVAVPGSTDRATGGIQNGSVQINDRGQVLFKSYPGGRVVQLNRYTEGIGVEDLAQAGPNAPDIANYGIQIPASTTAGMTLQQDGDVTFYAQLDVTPGVSGLPILRSAIYEVSGTGANRTVKLVGLEGDDALPGEPGRPWLPFQDTPEVALDGSTVDIPLPFRSTPSVQSAPAIGTYKDRTFTPAYIANVGEAILTDFQINDRGTIVVRINGPVNQSLVRIKPGEAPEILATGVPSNFGLFDLNEEDEVAWLQRTANGVEVLLNNGTSTRSVRNIGNIGVTALTQGTYIDLNDEGDVVFWFPFQQFIGLNENIDFDFSDRATSIESLVLNNNGDLGLYFGQSLEILRAGEMTPEVIVQQGDTIEVLPGDTRTVSQVLVSSFRVRNTDSMYFNNKSEFAYDVVFNQRPGDAGATFGVFTGNAAAIPLPASGVLFAAGLSALYVRRRTG